MSNMEKPPIPELKTSDIMLVTYLKYMNYSIHNIEKVNDRKASFTFTNVDREHYEQFNLDNSLVEPKMFLTLHRNLVRMARQTCQDQY
jgi:hypothetical protein